MLGRYEIRDDASLGYSVVVADEKLEGPRPPRQIRLLYRGPVQLARTKNLATMAEVIFAELETILYGERDDAIYLDLACLFTEGAGGLIPSAYPPTWPSRAAGWTRPESGYLCPRRSPSTRGPDGSSLPAPTSRSRCNLAAPGDFRRERPVRSAEHAGTDPHHVIFAPGSSQGPLQPVSRAFALYQLAGSDDEHAQSEGPGHPRSGQSRRAQPLLRAGRREPS